MTIIIPRRSVGDVAWEYGRFAEAAKTNLHALSGRGRPELTRLMNEAILRHLDFEPNQRVLDIGCGDASLLRAIPVKVSAVGTVLTREECARLAAAPQLDDIQFYAASFDDLHGIPGKFDRIVANGCLMFAPTEKDALRALENIAGLMASNGKLWLGELLAKKQRQAPYAFPSMKEAVRHVYRFYGPRFTLAFLRHLIRHHRRADFILKMPPRLWHIAPRDIPALAARLDLKVIGIWKCEDLTGEPAYTKQDRFSVLLSK